MASYIMAHPAPEWVRVYIRRAQSRHRAPSSTWPQGPTYRFRYRPNASGSSQGGEP